MSCLDMWLFCLCLLVAREQLATAQDKATKLCDANAMLTEQVVEAVRDCDAAAADPLPWWSGQVNIGTNTWG